MASSCDFVASCPLHVFCGVSKHVLETMQDSKWLSLVNYVMLQMKISPVLFVIQNLPLTYFFLAGALWCVASLPPTTSSPTTNLPSSVAVNKHCVVDQLFQVNETVVDHEGTTVAFVFWLRTCRPTDEEPPISPVPFSFLDQHRLPEHWYAKSHRYR